MRNARSRKESKFAAAIAVLGLVMCVGTLITATVPGLWNLGAKLLIWLAPVAIVAAAAGFGFGKRARIAGAVSLLAMCTAGGVALTGWPWRWCFEQSKPAFLEAAEALRDQARASDMGAPVDGYLGFYPVKEISYRPGAFVVVLDVYSLFGRRGFGFQEEVVSHFPLPATEWREIGDGWYHWSRGSD